MRDTNSVNVFRTKALRELKTFEVCATLEKPSQSLIVFISSVGLFNFLLFGELLTLSYRNPTPVSR